MPRSERRRHPRFPFHASGILHLADTPHHGTVLDISLNGALFRLPAPLLATPGQPCHLELRHAAEAACRVDTARIACQRGDLLGLEFGRLDHTARQFLLGIIEMNLAVSSLLDRELPALLTPPESKTLHRFCG